MNNKENIIIVILVCLVVGLLIAISIKSNTKCNNYSYLELNKTKYVLADKISIEGLPVVKLMNENKVEKEEYCYHGIDSKGNAILTKYKDGKCEINQTLCSIVKDNAYLIKYENPNVIINYDEECTK